MDKIVSDTEKELGIKIDRLDVLRNPYYRKLFEMIHASSNSDKQGVIPMLYHRGSRQKIYGLSKKQKVRALAKGMWLENLNLKEQEESINEPPLDAIGLEDDEDLSEDSLKRRGQEMMRKRRDQK